MPDQLDEFTSWSRDAINPAVRRNLGDYAGRFHSAKPFRHVVIDDFLKPELAEALLAQFPVVVDHSKLLTEFGGKGRKSTVSDVCSIGGAYTEIDNYIQSTDFLILMSQITGIPDLKYDPYYFGAGTHENLDGAGLDPHFDFNIHPKTAQHRRINAIVYLNKDWDPAWGGSICFHSDPWDLKKIEVTEVAPAFNRCAIFETTEHSWHSVPYIKLPADKKHLSRKSFTIYLYTDTRPPEEFAPSHGTVYVQFGLSRDLKAGRCLTQDDVDAIYENIERRNAYLRNLYKREYRFSEHIERQAKLIQELQLATYIPILGYAKLCAVRDPLFHDRFMGAKLDFSIDVVRPAQSLRFVGYRPENFEDAIDVTVSARDESRTERISRGAFEINLNFPEPLTGQVDITVTASKAQRPPQASDERNLSIIVDRIELGSLENALANCTATGERGHGACSPS